jgi:hypothetical protein
VPPDPNVPMIFFYEAVFVVVALAAVFVGEAWSRLAAFVILAVCLLVAVLAIASFDARLATAQALSDEDRRWFVDTRDGLKHLRLLFGLSALAALVWRLIAG